MHTITTAVCVLSLAAAGLALSGAPVYAAPLAVRCQRFDGTSGGLHAHGTRRSHHGHAGRGPVRHPR